VPRLALEWLAIFGLAALILGMVVQGRALADAAPIIGAFAAAAFRLMPSLNRILGSIQTLRYMSPVIDILHQQVQWHFGRAFESLTQLKFGRCIHFENVSFSYKPESGSVLRQVSLMIQKGKTVGFIGASGSGKSTLIDVLLGLLQPECGRVLVDGRDVQENLSAWRAMIGYVPQFIYLTDDTLRRNIAFGVPDDQIDHSAVVDAIKVAQLEAFVADLPEGIDTLVGEQGVRLSGGQRQRIGIARALYRNPDVLVFDEATSALDNKTEQEVMRPIVAMHGLKTIVLIAHRLSTVEHCDYIYKLEAGRIVAEGSPEEILFPQSGSGGQG